MLLGKIRDNSFISNASRWLRIVIHFKLILYQQVTTIRDIRSIFTFWQNLIDMLCIIGSALHSVAIATETVLDNLGGSLRGKGG